jgi:transcription initiation factor TFIID TATA-box-binding protein
VIKAAIVNVVATATVNQEIDLYELGKFSEVLYDPEIYNGRVAYFKASSMRGRVSIFTSGKMISVGTKNESEAFRELECTKDFLVRKGFIKPITLECKIQNMVVEVNLGKSVNLEELAKNCKVVYEPEQFPGAILKIHEPHKATILIFASGRAIIAGLKGSDQISFVIQKMLEILKEYVC